MSKWRASVLLTLLSGSVMAKGVKLLNISLPVNSINNTIKAFSQYWQKNQRSCNGAPQVSWRCR
ncbi:MAG: hypothetical protein GPOALKHO_001052 [Sodalis sp.]|nr:MAG: hypothetical protein GPOALKHO_001052 [Sodalis sp.]